MKDNLGFEKNDAYIEMHDWFCASCGCLMSMPKELNGQLRRSHAKFYCVSGHVNMYSTKTELEEVQGKLMNEYAKNAQLEKEIEKLKKSVVNRIFKP